MPVILVIFVTTLFFDTNSFLHSIKVQGCVFHNHAKRTGKVVLYIIRFGIVKVPADEIVRGFELNNNKYFLNLFL